MAREARIDTMGTVRGVERTPQGGVRVLANVARADSVLRYRDTEGKQWSEFVPAASLFDEASLATLRGAPVTDLHPPTMVDGQNYADVQKGHTADGVGHDGPYVTAPLVVLDGDLTSKILAGERPEVSPGYTSDIDWTPGTTPSGEHYDAVQGPRRYNHVALGPAGWGRAGSDVSLRMDGAAIQVQAPTVVTTNAQRADSAQRATMPKKLKIKGKEYRCDDDNEMVAAQNEMDSVAAAGDEAAAKVGSLSAELEAVKVVMMEGITKLAAAEAKAKAAEAAAAGSADPKKVTEDDVPDDVADSIATKRLALRERASKILGADAKFTRTDAKGATVSMSTAEIHREVVAKALPTVKLDGLSAETVAGMFAAVTSAPVTTERADAAAASMAAAGNAAVGDPAFRFDAAGDASVSLQNRLIERGAKPIAAVKGSN